MQSLIHHSTPTGTCASAVTLASGTALASTTTFKMNHNRENIEPNHCSAVLVPEHSTVKANCILGKYNLRTKSIQNRIEIEKRRNQSEGKSKSKSKNRAAPLSKYRRKTANARERNRMQEINEAFETLKRIMPKSVADEINENKLTKITTLRLAVNYIAALTRMLQDTDTDAPASINQQTHGTGTCLANLHSGPSDTPHAPFDAHLCNVSNPQVTNNRLPMVSGQSSQHNLTTDVSVSPRVSGRPVSHLSSTYFTSGSSPVVQVVSSNAIACTYKMRLQPPPPPMSVAERAQHVKHNGTFAVHKKRPHLQMHPYTVKRPHRGTSGPSLIANQSLVYANSSSCPSMIPTTYHHMSTDNQNQSVDANVSMKAQQVITQTDQSHAQCTMAPVSVARTVPLPVQPVTSFPVVDSPCNDTCSESAVSSVHPPVDQTLFDTNEYQCVPLSSPIDDLNGLNYGELANLFHSDSASTCDSLDSLLESCNSATSGAHWSHNSAPDEYSLHTLFATTQPIDLY